MRVTLNVIPPNSWGNNKKVSVRAGRVFVRENEGTKGTKEMLYGLLAPHAPERPLDTAVGLKVYVVWPYRKSERKSVVRSGNLLWKTSNPDGDNVLKTIKDVMTHLGFWADDALVCDEQVMRYYGPKPQVVIEVWEFQDGPEDPW